MARSWGYIHVRCAHTDSEASYVTRLVRALHGESMYSVVIPNSVYFVHRHDSKFSRNFWPSLRWVAVDQYLTSPAVAPEQSIYYIQGSPKNPKKGVFDHFIQLNQHHWCFPWLRLNEVTRRGNFTEKTPSPNWHLIQNIHFRSIHFQKINLSLLESAFTMSDWIQQVICYS